MEFTRSTRFAARFVPLASAGSTNDELARRAREGSRDDWPEFSVVVTDTQTAGRGRLGRAWTAPPGTMLAVSVLLWPRDAGITRPDSLGWLPLMAGVAMTRSVRRHGVAAELKWPNDVLVGDKKLCGILSELVSDGDGSVVVGAGVNLTLSEAELPVPTATSMAIEGATASADDVLADYLSELRELYRGFVAAAGAADEAGLLDAVSSACSTLGQTVRVELPGRAPLIGVAESLDTSGRIVVDVDGHRTPVAAGDVTHLRY